jgi:arylformamidase
LEALEDMSSDKTLFLTYDQAELDRQYDQRAWAKNAVEIINLYGTKSDEVRGRIGLPQTYPYGDGPSEVLDLYLCQDTQAPIHVFIHGGAWRQLSRHESSFAAEVFTSAGAHFVALDFSLIPAATLPEMVRQVRIAIKWLYEHGSRVGGDHEKIFVSGHSSGAHLAASVITTDWPTEFGLPPSTVKGALCISGIYDLEPVRLSARNEFLKLDVATSHVLSPLRHVDQLSCKTVVAYGQYESQEFIRQAREFAAAVAQSGHLQQLVEGQNRNHFEIALDLAEPQSLLTQLALEQMGLGPK